MRKTTKSLGGKIVKDIRRATRRQYSSEEKIRIVPDGLRGEGTQTVINLLDWEHPASPCRSARAGKMARAQCPQTG